VFPLFATGVIDNDGKFSTCVVILVAICHRCQRATCDTGGNFSRKGGGDVVDASGKFVVVVENGSGETRAKMPKKRAMLLKLTATSSALRRISI
jgi:hypothetical protein